MSYANGLVADEVHPTGVTTASLQDGAVTLSKLDPTIGVWTRSGEDVYRSAGNVGIGTVQPSSPLEVVGNIKAGSASFGASLSPKLNLYGTSFGIGIQNCTLYSRVSAGCAFGWYAGGAHADGPLDNGGGTTLMILGGGGLVVNGLLVPASDRNLKENFAAVRPREMLEKVVALPLSSWNLKADPATRHVGPMAQDFYAAFGVGPDDKHIATVDADGVALAAIQGLNEKVEAQQSQLEQKETEITELKARMEKLEQLMNHKLKRGTQ